MAANLSRRSVGRPMPPCVGGLNDRDAITSMPSEDALNLENMFPGTSDCQVRGGCVEWATGATGETLMGYNGITGSNLFMASGANIYDISTSGAIGAPVVTGLFNARWDFQNFGGAAGNFLVAVNGINLPHIYNGTTWAASGTGFATPITGVSASTFSQVNVWKNRLFFVQKDTLKVWYLPVQAIGGAAVSIDFSGVAKLGGKLIATATVSSTSGQTVDDYFVAITSEGELLVYAGTDPANAATFALVGNFRMGRPIANGSDNQGGRFLCRFSSNVIAITVDGFINLQDALNVDVVSQKRIINDKIINSVSRDVTAFKSNFGWQAVLMPIKNRLFINVPTSSTTSRQYVMNTITGAWGLYTGWDATCFHYWQDNLYACIGNKVYTMDIEKVNDFSSITSSGNPINFFVRTSFSYFGSRNNHKSFKMVRPLFFATGAVLPSINVDVDFKETTVLGSSNVLAATNAKWGPGFAKWGPGFAKWGTESVYTRNWLSVTGIGYSAALVMKGSINQQMCSWQGWDITYSNGGLI